MELVCQLVNYDDWLEKQHATHRRAFVLATSNLKTKLPPNLKCKWTCLNWTLLGLEVKAAIVNKKLPPEEAVLTKHLFGFIHTNLWSTKEMPEIKLDFNDIALIRAFSQIGRDCEKRANALMETVRPFIK